MVEKNIFINKTLYLRYLNKMETRKTNIRCVYKSVRL